MPDPEPITAEALPPETQETLDSSQEHDPPMIDIHPSTHPANTWREFFIHIATIVLGLLIAVGLEQSVEYLHHRNEARDARASIQQELVQNESILHNNLDRLAADQQQLGKNMDLLDSTAPDAQTLPALQYSWYLFRLRDAAWNAAKTDGSIALIAPREIGEANYFYSSNAELTPVYFAYFTGIDAAAGIVDHARIAGKLDQAEREQLRNLTASAIGQTRVLSLIISYQLKATKSKNLDR